MDLLCTRGSYTKRKKRNEMSFVFGRVRLSADEYYKKGAAVLQSRLDEFLSTDRTTLLTSIQGEWSVFYLKKEAGKLICGRDIFARKSLCWKLSRAASGSGGVLEISTFPGQTSGDWSEVFPGTFFIFSLLENECDSASVFVNKFITDHRVLKCSMLRAEFCENVRLRVISLFPRELFADDEFVNAFATVEFTYLNSDHLLKPTSNILSDAKELDAVGAEFYRRFCEGMDGIGVNSKKLSAGERIMVLFSGGVDSFLVAFMAGRLAPAGVEILLVNVAFGETCEECNEAPDRQRSINAFNFLRGESESNSANAKFRLILVNVGRVELAECRRAFIAPAIFPARSVLDDSIGCVLWFAARAKGVEYTDGDAPMKSVDFSRSEDVKFVLVGSGADEQLGGYARHRTIFEKFGFERLAEELAMELSRIGRRNFGRDDRIATANRRILLAPFLEEPFVEWLNQVPLSLKVDFSLPRGEGEKRLLRRVLVQQGVPLPLASQPKRAMQFGSRIAKLENRREKGSDVCERLITHGTD